MKRYLITGGLGFIGSHLSKFLLDHNCEVTILDNQVNGDINKLDIRAKYINGDILNQYDLLEALEGCDGCFHLAAIASVALSKEQWFESHRVNISGMVNLLEVLKTLKLWKHHVNLIYASSAAVYGADINIPLKENTVLSPISTYGIDKLACELHARIASCHYNIPNIGLRLFNVFGKGQSVLSSYSGVITNFINAIKQNKKIIIFGDGAQTRDFIYIDDAVRAMWYAMQRVTEYSGNIFNVCTGIETKIIDLANIIGTIFDKNIEISYKKRKQSDIYRSYGCSEKIYKSLGFQSQCGLKQGLKKMIIEESFYITN